MKVLLLTRYSRSGASSRLRYYQYLPFLKAHGVDVDIYPLFEEQYLKRLNAGQPQNPASILSAYLHRIFRLITSRAYDLLWLEYEALPWLPDWLERILGRGAIPYIVDYDDAIFHRYDRHALPWVRSLLGHKIDAVMRNARLVIAGNAYLSQKAVQSGAKWVKCLPTVVDPARYRMKPSGKSPVFTIGWIGSPTTAAYLVPLYAVLGRLSQRSGIRLILVGGNPKDVPSAFPVECRPWSEETEAEHMLDFDVGIMPIPDEPWAYGKCGYKLIQYMACGLPVVASRVGANIRIVKDGVNGYLASTDEHWELALRALQENPELRRAMGSQGRMDVEALYSLQVMAPRLANLIRDSLNSNWK
ncbi:MAG: glycosyltransferase family 4 protein [Deltaproteobacteria bacterium]|nr:glycosyltransferase family 4 protein [Deltaproteobacteria bacterium]